MIHATKPAKSIQPNTIEEGDSDYNFDKLIEHMEETLPYNIYWRTGAMGGIEQTTFKKSKEIIKKLQEEGKTVYGEGYDGATNEEIYFYPEEK